ncbi:unnamed protein product [Adineta ricciae]|uniref:Uncharacterized protein n=1 Tax=Adineta ricciae TaxID=249248 RepID=A0A814F0G0_ADIRI|nr:unnamed protein product [Adineta ricciae]CAF1114047.1 unnamed protein product [Adineta ricciae]
MSSLIEATPASIAEQIRQIFSSNITKPNSSTGETISPPLVPKTLMNTLPDNLKIERTVASQMTNNIKDSPKDYVGHHNQSQQQQQQQNTQSSFSYTKSEPVSVTPPAFSYTPSSVSNIGAFAGPNFSSYDSATSPLPLNSSLKPTTPVTVPNFASQPSTYFYPVPTQCVYPPSLNSTAVNTAAAIFQAYSQFNVQPPGAPSIVNQQMTTQQQQQQIRK